MVSEELKWVVGVFITVGLAMVTHTLTGFRNLRNKQSADVSELHKELSKVKEDKASKSDLKIMTDHIDQRITDLREDGHRRHDELKDLLRSSK